MGGDPINKFDPRGLFESLASGCGAPGTDFCISDGFLGNGFSNPQPPWMWSTDGYGGCNLPGLGSGYVANVICGLAVAAAVPSEAEAEPDAGCTIQIGGVPILGGTATHSFIRVIAPNGVPGSFGAGTTIMEGVDETARNAQAKDAPPGLNGKRKYLNARPSADGMMAGSYSVSQNIVFDQTSPELCDIAAELIARFKSYKNWTLEYHAIAGPNSNSFVKWLIKPFKVFATVQGPPKAVGWDKDEKIP